MVDFRKLHVGDKLIWSVEEPWDSKPFERNIVVTDVNSERAIAVCTDDRTVHLWIDDDTADDYRVY